MDNVTFKPGIIAEGWQEQVEKKKVVFPSPIDFVDFVKIEFPKGIQKRKVK